MLLLWAPVDTGAVIDTILAGRAQAGLGGTVVGFLAPGIDTAQEDARERVADARAALVARGCAVRDLADAVDDPATLRAAVAELDVLYVPDGDANAMAAALPQESAAVLAAHIRSDSLSTGVGAGAIVRGLQLPPDDGVEPAPAWGAIPLIVDIGSAETTVLAKAATVMIAPREGIGMQFDPDDPTAVNVSVFRPSLAQQTAHDGVVADHTGIGQGEASADAPSRVGGSGGPFDTTAFTERVARREVRAFWRGFRREFPAAADRAGTIKRVLFTTIVWLGWSVILLTVLGMWSQLLDTPRDERAGQAYGMVAVLMLFVVGYVTLTWTVVRMRRRRVSPQRYLRLTRFAEANRMNFGPGHIPAAHLPAQVRELQGRFSDVLLSRGAVFANRERSQGEGAGGTMFDGIAAIPVSTDLPNLHLAAKRARRVTFGFVPAAGQQLALEGDVGRHFTGSSQMTV